MVTNSMKMITPFRFLTFLGLFVIGLLVYSIGKTPKSSVYVPSDSILISIENEENALSVCKNVVDSFYVLLRNAEKSISNSDTTVLKENLESARLLLDVELPINLTSKYFKMRLGPLPISIDKSVVAQNAYDFFGGLDNIHIATKDIFFDLVGQLPKSKLYDSEIVERLLKCVPMDSSSFLGRLHLIKSYSLKDSFKLEEALESVNEALVLLSKDTINNDKHYARALEHSMNLYYVMEEYESFDEYAGKAKKFFNTHDLDINEIERFYYNYNLILINRGHETSLASLQSIDEYALIEQSLLTDFRFNYLCANWNSFYASDAVAIQYYQEAIDLTNKEGNDISEMQWIDVRKNAIYAMMQIEDNDLALDLIEEIKDKVKDYTSFELFQSSAIVQTFIAEAYILSYLATSTNKKNEREILKAVDRFDDFLRDLEIYILELNPENVHYIHNIYRSIYDYKFELLFELHLLKPNKGYDELALFENDKLKANNHFYRKFCNSKSKLTRFSDLRKRQLKQSKSITENNVGFFENELILDTIRREFQKYYGIIYEGRKSYISKAVEFCRVNNTDILEYYSGNYTDYGFLVTSKGVTMIEMDEERPDVELYLEKLDQQATDFDSINNVFYNYLYEPFESNQMMQNLIVVSTGVIDKISFESFKNSGRYLLENKTVAYAYSIKSLLLEGEEYGNDIPHDSIIAYSFTNTETLKSKTKTALKELSSGYSECLALKKTFPEVVKIISGSEATKDHFLQNAFDYEIVHLASHGQGRKNSIRNNKLFFRSSVEEEALSMKDFSREKNPKTKLLFLNACETNKGKEIINEGSISIARSFAELGIDNIITSSIPINDYSSMKLSDTFYEYLSKSYGIAVSLRKSKLDYLLSEQNIKKTHPFYWAGLKLYKS